jgi:hypothetical protein
MNFKKDMEELVIAQFEAVFWHLLGWTVDPSRDSSMSRLKFETVTSAIQGRTFPFKPTCLGFTIQLKMYCMSYFRFITYHFNIYSKTSVTVAE